MKTVVLMMALAIGALVAMTGTASAECNSYGCYEPGGGCNSYGCFPRGGGCNSYGCWGAYGGCNSYGCWRDGGGCNSYGCWNSPQGSCNSYGCSDYGECNAYGCPVPPPRHRRGHRHASNARPDEADRFFAAIERSDDC